MTGLIGFASAALVLVGLVILERNRPAGSWMITIGSVPVLLTLLALNPIALLAAATIASGLWTGNLAFTTRPAQIDPNRPNASPAAARGTQWFLWLIATIVLFGFGLGTLLVADLVDTSEQENSAIGGLVYFPWLLSWAAAAATGAIGIALGMMRLITRHRTRTA